MKKPVKPAKKTTRHHHRHHLDRRAATLRETPQAAGDDDDLLPAEEVAAWLGVSEVWLVVGRQRGYGPRFQKLAGHVVRYKRSSVRAWLAEREFASVKEAKAKQARDKKLKLSAGRASAEA